MPAPEENATLKGNLPGTFQGNQSNWMSWIGPFLHQLPRLDKEFRQVNSTFSPQDVCYLESLLFWAAVPIAVLLVTYSIVGIFGCCLCCKKTSKRSRGKPICLKVCLVIFIVLLCGALGVSVWANENIKEGATSMVSRLRGIDDNLTDTQLEILELDRLSNQNMTSEINSLTSYLRELEYPRDAAKRRVNDLVRSLHSNVRELQREVTSVPSVNQSQFGNLVEHLSLFENIRWISMICMTCFFAVLFLMLFCAMCFNSPCCLCFFITFEVLALFLGFCISGAHLAFSIGVSDLCAEPERLFNKETSMGFAASDGLLDHYSNCSNQRQELVSTVEHHVAAANVTVSTLFELLYGTFGHMERQTTFERKVKVLFSSASVSIDHLLVLSDCRHVDENRTGWLNSLCHVILPGTALIALAFFVIGLLIAVMLCISISLRHKLYTREEYETEECDPFLPKHGSGRGAPAASRHRRGPSAPPISFYGRGSPPPPYGGPSTLSDQSHQDSCTRRISLAFLSAMLITSTTGISLPFSRGCSPVAPPAPVDCPLFYLTDWSVVETASRRRRLVTGSTRSVAVRAFLPSFSTLSAKVAKKTS